MQQRLRQSKDLRAPKPVFFPQLTLNFLGLNSYPATHHFSVTCLSNMRDIHRGPPTHSLFLKVQLDVSQAALQSKDSCFSEPQTGLILCLTPFLPFPTNGFLPKCLLTLPVQCLPRQCPPKAPDDFPESWWSWPIRNKRNKMWPSG